MPTPSQTSNTGNRFTIIKQIHFSAVICFERHPANSDMGTDRHVKFRTCFILWWKTDTLFPEEINLNVVWSSECRRISAAGQADMLSHNLLVSSVLLTVQTQYWKMIFCRIELAYTGFHPDIYLIMLIFLTCSTKKNKEKKISCLNTKLQ